MATKEIVLTQEGYENLQAEYRNLIDVERPQVIEALQNARAMGDLSENADYDAARNKQAEIEGRITEIENILANAKIVAEGKTKASLAFFSYIDSLQSDIQKETSLDLLCQTFSLKPEAVRRDFSNRNAAQKRIETRQQDIQRPELTEKIKLNAEIRSLLAVIANLDFYPLMRSSLSSDDFEDSVAKDMFIILEECYRSEALSYSSILAKCSETVGRLITDAVMSGEYGENSRKTIEDCIQLIKRNSLVRRRDRLVNKIRQCVPHDRAEQEELESMVLEKMSIDSELNKQKELHSCVEWSSKV